MMSGNPIGGSISCYIVRYSESQDHVQKIYSSPSHPTSTPLAAKASSDAIATFTAPALAARVAPGFRPARLLTSHELQLIILFLISERPAHGYEIIKEMERRSSGMYTPSPGVVYPALTYLEEASLRRLRARWRQESLSDHRSRRRSLGREPSAGR